MKVRRFSTAQMDHFPQWIGFDSIFDRMDRILLDGVKTPSYPPYNIKQVNESTYQIEMAVSGFSKDDIEITHTEDQLVVKANGKPDESNYIHKGIATRAFEQTFTLSPDVVIGGADIVNGILKIDLSRIIPEERKPKKIQIGGLNSYKPELLTEGA